MSFDETYSSPEHSEQDRLAERETVKGASKAERVGLAEEVQTDTILEGMEGAEFTKAKAALEFAYAQQYINRNDQPEYQREILKIIQTSLLVYGELAAIPPEEIQPFLKHESERQGDAERKGVAVEADKENVKRKGEAVEKDAANQSLIDLRAEFPDLSGAALVDAMLGKLDPEAPDHATKQNTLMAIRLLFASKTTAPRVQQALDSDTAFEPATLRSIAVDFLAADDVSEEQKAEVRSRLGIVDTGSQLDDALDLPTEAGSDQPYYHEGNPIQVRQNVQAYVKPDGEKMLVIDIPDDLGNSRKLYRSFESMRGEEIGEYANVMIAIQFTQHAGLPDVFGKGFSQVHGTAEIQVYPSDVVRMQQLFGALLSDFDGSDGRIISEAQIARARYALQWFSPKGDAMEGDFDTTAMRKNLKDLGIMDTDNQIIWTEWERAGDFIQLNFASGKPDFEMLKAIMNEGGFGGR